MNYKYISSIDDLKNHILTRTPSLYLGAQTSTVIPFENLPEEIKKLTLCSLEKMPATMELLPHNELKVTGPVSWQDARIFLRSKNRDLMTTPTEELASILAGAATSATGERCFGLGTLRDQITEITYMDFKGEFQTLKRENPFN